MYLGGVICRCKHRLLLQAFNYHLFPGIHAYSIYQVIPLRRVSEFPRQTVLRRMWLQQCAMLQSHVGVYKYIVLIWGGRGVLCGVFLGLILYEVFY